MNAGFLNRVKLHANLSFTDDDKLEFLAFVYDHPNPVLFEN